MVSTLSPQHRLQETRGRWGYHRVPNRRILVDFRTIFTSQSPGQGGSGRLSLRRKLFQVSKKYTYGCKLFEIRYPRSVLLRISFDENLTVGAWPQRQNLVYHYSTTLRRKIRKAFVSEPVHQVSEFYVCVSVKLPNYYFGLENNRQSAIVTGVPAEAKDVS